MNLEQARRLRDYAELAQRQHEYNEAVARKSVERAECEAIAKDAATRRSIERALTTVLLDGLTAFPDVFRETQLSADTAAVWAEKWTADIA